MYIFYISYAYKNIYIYTYIYIHYICIRGKTYAQNSCFGAKYRSLDNDIASEAYFENSITAPLRPMSACAASSLHLFNLFNGILVFPTCSHGVPSGKLT